MWIDFLFLDYHSWSYKPDVNGEMSVEQSKALVEQIQQHGRIIQVRLQMGL
jgi:N-dimethylarginine dimethylaminohydrolase